MPATAAWLASVEALLNRYVAASAQARAVAQRLQMTSMQIEAGSVRIRASVCGGRLALSVGDDSAADAVISGSAPALLQLLRGGAKRNSARAAAQVRGDAEVANQYRELFMVARPDWEEELSRIIGDFPARRVSQLAVGLRNFARRARRTAGVNIAEYLQEESRDLVNRPEMEEFLRGVDELRETADRIEVRLERLEQRARGAN